MRIDKWLWAARFFKTRGVAQEAIAAGRVKLNGDRVKPAHAIKPGDAIQVRIQEFEWKVTVLGLSDKRGPAPEARKLYEEVQASRIERERLMDVRRWAAEPSSDIKGRPTKRDRRDLERLRGK
jgi:ribosome-associated heat shock protein Hsp15